MRKYLPQLDLLKAFAIISVITLHSVFDDILVKRYYSPFHIAQAVPIFIIIMGLNESMSFNYKNYSNIKDIYSINYLTKKITRILLPFLVVLFFSFYIGNTDYYENQGKLAYKGLFLLVGYLPTPGPGNYYITLVFQFVLFFPVIYILYRKYPKITLLGSLILNILFELYAKYGDFFNKDIYGFSHYLYSACILRFIFIIVLGIWISVDYSLTSKRNLFIYPFAIISIIYLLMVVKNNYIFPYFLPSWQPLNVLDFPYAFLIVLLGLALLPKTNKNIIVKVISVIGKASYHIFLVQTIYFAVYSNNIRKAIQEKYLVNLNTRAAIKNLLICISVGLIFYLIEYLIRNFPKLLRKLFEYKTSQIKQ